MRGFSARADGFAYRVSLPVLGADEMDEKVSERRKEISLLIVELMPYLLPLMLLLRW
jgi:hypothetical protein